MKRGRTFLFYTATCTRAKFQGNRTRTVHVRPARARLAGARMARGAPAESIRPNRPRLFSAQARGMIRSSVNKHGLKLPAVRGQRPSQMLAEATSRAEGGLTWSRVWGLPGVGHVEGRLLDQRWRVHAPADEEAGAAAQEDAHHQEEPGESRAGR